MPELFHGFCPICSRQLLVNDEPSELASCYCLEGHYSCQVSDFNRLWKEFDAHVEQLGTERASAAYGEQLLHDLQALNTEVPHGTE